MITNKSGLSIDIEMAIARASLDFTCLEMLEGQSDDYRRGFEDGYTLRADFDQAVREIFFYQ